MIRLLIVAPSAVVRAGLESLALSSPGVQVAGAFADFLGAEELQPDVVLSAAPLNAIPPPTNGWRPAVVLLTGESEPEWTADAARLGVRALLPSDASPASILAAVESAAAGFAVVQARDLEEWLSSRLSIEHAAIETPLTPRELEVLRMMADGDANKIIAWKLRISEHTVKFHVASILGKLNAGTRTEAVTIGIRRGLVLV